MEHKNESAEIIFPCEEDVALLEEARVLIAYYAERQLMLEQTMDDLIKIAAQGMLALSVTPDTQEVIGTCGYTFEWPDGNTELGAWAISPSFRDRGYGVQLLSELAKKNGSKNIIAFGNDNSGPVFEKLGATKIDQSKMHPDAFIPCQTCNCDKSQLKEGDKCVDAIYDLSEVINRLIDA